MKVAYWRLGWFNLQNPPSSSLSNPWLSFFTWLELIALLHVFETMRWNNVLLQFFFQTKQN
eukprot:c3732_g1_i1 orf=1-180(-)